MPKRYAKGKFAVGECARSGRKMLLKHMVSDGYYPSLVVDPAWYEGKHPQESLPEIEDPVSLWRPAPERDQSGATFRPDRALLFTGFAVRCIGTEAVDNVFDAEDATEYGATEDELANNPENGGGNFRFDAFWKPDGTRCYTARGLSFEIAQNDVSPAWDIQNIWTNRVTTPNVTNIRSIWWSPDGTKLSASVRVPSTAFRIISWDQSATPWDLTVLGAAVSKTIGVASGGPNDHIWSADGLTMWQFYQGVIFQIIEYPASVAFDPTTLGVAAASFDMTPDTGTGVKTIAFSADGTVLYAMNSQFLVSWDLGTAFDVTTASNFQTGPTVLAGDLGIPRGLFYRPDNGDIFVEGDQNQRRVAWFRTP